MPRATFVETEDEFEDFDSVGDTEERPPWRLTRWHWIATIVLAVAALAYFGRNDPPLSTIAAWGNKSYRPAVTTGKSMPTTLDAQPKKTNGSVQTGKTLTGGGEVIAFEWNESFVAGGETWIIERVDDKAGKPALVRIKENYSKEVPYADFVDRKIALASENHRFFYQDDPGITEYVLYFAPDAEEIHLVREEEIFRVGSGGTWKLHVYCESVDGKQIPRRIYMTWEGEGSRDFCKHNCQYGTECCCYNRPTIEGFFGVDSENNRSGGFRGISWNRQDGWFKIGYVPPN